MLDHERATRRCAGFLARPVLASDSVAIPHRAVRQLGLTSRSTRSSPPLDAHVNSWPVVGRAYGYHRLSPSRQVAPIEGCQVPPIAPMSAVGRESNGGARVRVLESAWGFQGTREGRTVSDE